MIIDRKIFFPNFFIFFFWGGGGHVPSLPPSPTPMDRYLMYSTEDGHDDVGITALYVGEKWNDLINDDHLVETADQSVDALQSVHSRLLHHTHQLLYTLSIRNKKAQLTQGLRATAPSFQDGRQSPSWILSNR